MLTIIKINKKYTILDLSECEIFENLEEANTFVNELLNPAMTNKLNAQIKSMVKKDTDLKTKNFTKLKSGVLKKNKTPMKESEVVDIYEDIDINEKRNISNKVKTFDKKLDAIKNPTKRRTKLIGSLAAGDKNMGDTESFKELVSAGKKAKSMKESEDTNYDMYNESELMNISDEIISEAYMHPDKVNSYVQNKIIKPSQDMRKAKQSGNIEQEIRNKNKVKHAEKRLNKRMKIANAMRKKGTLKDIAVT